MRLTHTQEVGQVYFQQNKKKAKKGKNCHAKTMESGKADIAYIKDTPHVPLRQIAEGKIRG